MGKGSAPEAPDYTGAAQATAQGNLDAARLAAQANRADQYTPWGSSVWTNNRVFDQAGYDAAMAEYQRQLDEYNQSQFSSPTNDVPDYLAGLGDSWWGTSNSQQAPGSFRSRPIAPDRDSFWGGGDDWTQTVTLSPEMQALLDQQNRLQQGLFGAQDLALGRVNEAMGQGFDMSGIPSGGTALDPSKLPGFGSVYDPTLQTNNATELLMQRISPEMDRQQEALRAQLANQGITQGSAAYNNAIGQFGQIRNDAQTQAALAGINLGMQQQGLQFGQQTTNQQLAAALQGQQFGQSQQARQQALAEQAYLRNLPLNELNALRTGNQVSMPQFPAYAQQATTGGADILGAANAGYQAQLGAYNAQQAQNSGMMGGLFGLGGGILGAMYGGPTGAAIGANIGSGLGGGLFSDRRLKRDIKPVGIGAHGLTVYSYRYVWGGPTQLGYMADEVERIAPHAVGESGGFKTVNYGEI